MSLISLQCPYRLLVCQQHIPCTRRDSDEVIKERIRNFSVENALKDEPIDYWLKDLLIGVRHSVMTTLELVSQCSQFLQSDPEKRLTLLDALQHPYFDGM